MIGRAGTAPCGHKGEAIIGTYYACTEGCDTNGRRIAPRRGKEGHVDMCACRECYIRRTVDHIVLKTDDGSTVEHDWNGVDDISGDRPAAWKARHWLMYDSKWKLVAKGDILADLVPGKYYIRPLALPGLMFLTTQYVQPVMQKAAAPPPASWSAWQNVYKNLKSTTIIPYKGPVIV